MWTVVVDPVMGQRGSAGFISPEQPQTSSSSSRSQLGPSRRSTMGWPVSRGWQKQIQCRCGVVLSSVREDSQDDVSSPCQLNDRMLGRPGNVGRCVLESPE